MRRSPHAFQHLALIFVAFILLTSAGIAESTGEVTSPFTSGSLDSGSFSSDIMDGTSGIPPANNTTTEDLTPVVELSGTIMHPTQEELQRWVTFHNSAPAITIIPELMAEVEAAPGGSLSLLSHLQYTPADRNQGSCGNCWAWAGTGVMEIALDVTRGIRDRLSIQYLNSNYNGGSGSNWACCGGWLAGLASFYSGTGMAIPWSNTNAHYQDGTRSCASGSTSVAAGSISTTPS